MESSDEDLWRRVQAGESDAWPGLCARHWAMVGRFFSNKVGDNAEELRQRTFARLQGARDGFAERASFRAFVLGVARNILREFFRERTRDARFELGHASAADLGIGPATAAERREETEQLLAALRRLPLETQTLLELFYWEDLTSREIADVLEMKEDTVRGKLVRARRRLNADLVGLRGTDGGYDTTS